jgi:hypothetical protein
MNVSNPLSNSVWYNAAIGSINKKAMAAKNLVMIL